MAKDPANRSKNRFSEILASMCFYVNRYIARMWCFKMLWRLSELIESLTDVCLFILNTSKLQLLLHFIFKRLLTSCFDSDLLNYSNSTSAGFKHVCSLEIENSTVATKVQCVFFCSIATTFCLNHFTFFQFVEIPSSNWKKIKYSLYFTIYLLIHCSLLDFTTVPFNLTC